jgi:hypothetical protein
MIFIGFLGFPLIGTPIALLNASTWFHAKSKGRQARFSGPACRPFNF